MPALQLNPLEPNHMTTPKFRVIHNQGRAYWTQRTGAIMAYAIEASGKSNATLADESGVGTRTVQKLRLGLTKSPHFATIAMLAPMVGLKSRDLL